MIDFVKARDGHCRFPGCPVSATFCDLDHVVPWPVGATHPANLVCLCRRHHRVKQRPRWRVLLDPDGTLTWTDPTGRMRTTAPIDHLQLEPAATAHRGPVDTGTANAGASGGHTTTATTATAADARARAELPSALEDDLDHLLAARLVELACQPDHLTTRNAKAIRTGARIDTRRLQTALPRRSVPVQILRPARRITIGALGLHRRLGSPETPPPTDAHDPPPF
jgi:hypothetical protein